MQESLNFLTWYFTFSFPIIKWPLDEKLCYCVSGERKSSTLSIRIKCEGTISESPHHPYLSILKKKTTPLYMVSISFRNYGKKKNPSWTLLRIWQWFPAYQPLWASEGTQRQRQLTLISEEISYIILKETGIKGEAFSLGTKSQRFEAILAPDFLLSLNLSIVYLCVFVFYNFAWLTAYYSGENDVTRRVLQKT